MDVRAASSPVAELTCAALRETGTEPLSCYERLFTEACSAHPPPFGMAWYGDHFRDVAVDPWWLAGSLIANAEKEAEGARKLRELAGRCGDSLVSDAIRRHAIDEARHATMYIAMLDAAFPEAIGDDLRGAVDALSPKHRLADHPERGEAKADAIVLDELVQMNIGEIRTRIHQLLLRPVIVRQADPGGVARVERIMDALLSDETAHIQYTARFIERSCEAGHADLVARLMNERLREFNEITLREVGEARFVGE